MCVCVWGVYYVRVFLSSSTPLLFPPSRLWLRLYMLLRADKATDDDDTVMYKGQETVSSLALTFFLGFFFGCFFFGFPNVSFAAVAVAVAAMCCSTQIGLDLLASGYPEVAGAPHPARLHVRRSIMHSTSTKTSSKRAQNAHYRFVATCVSRCQRAVELH
ncbi:LANO_0H06854g1_1 [Lachancea nothofagi CBS 11611]|uniref:LANO_0H06854g1_1 n=1 Tax=Lachancea nothofagi CBS 11611 TaxID=1266666 RepID=A0A1G4KLP8_9SACH|nr:LANO_0H06854g1_1 [Lachancea nothofagi CBS 11611]